MVCAYRDRGGGSDRLSERLRIYLTSLYTRGKKGGMLMSNYSDEVSLDAEEFNRAMSVVRDLLSGKIDGSKSYPRLVLGALLGIEDKDKIAKDSVQCGCPGEKWHPCCSWKVDNKACTHPSNI